MTAPSALPGPALLFCPGDRPDRFDKAVAAADAVILDLEDAVAPDQKDEAREHVVRALEDLDPARTVVRINGTGTPWHAADVAALAARPDLVVMVPMAADVDALDALTPHPVIALCETAAGVLAAPTLAAAPQCVALMWGSEDLVADLGGRAVRTPTGQYLPAVEAARTRVLYAARAAGVTPIDTVLIDIADAGRLRADSVDAAASGFAAKACVHPTQVAVVREAFGPTAEEVDGARAVTAATNGRSVFRFRGRMVDAPVLARAAAVLRRATPTTQEEPR